VTTPTYRFIRSDPTKYHPFTIKFIMVMDNRLAIANWSVYDYHKCMAMNSVDETIGLIKKQMRLFIKRQQCKSFETNGFHIEIHLNTYYEKFFYTVGTDPQRFYGASQYFETAANCELEAIHEMSYRQQFKEGYESKTIS